MDLTYKPYIRDSAFKTLSIKTPSIVINGYKPKYTTDTKSEESEEASPVESPIEEIKTTQPSTVKHSSKTFKSKEEFKSTMLPIYESILIKKGLNPLFAKALVAQDGLESAWGSKLSGKYNFGGIKGKGTIARTREVINGQDVYINDSFRDFDSIEDYANYKVDLLNNNRYKAFSGDISEFASRVHKGGYATDPNYTNALNNVIASIKHGGVLKFQEGGLLEGKKWVQNWYQNRKPIIKRNIQQNQRIPFPVTESLGYNILTRNMNLTNASVNPSKVPEDAKGIYYPRGRRIYLKEDSASSAVHEWTHSSNPDAQIREINKIKELLGDAFYDQRSVIPDNYLDDAQEIYSRLMQLRHALKIDPNHKFTNEEVEALKQDRIKQETLTNRLKGKKNNSFSTTVFDKNNQVIYSEPFNPEYKYVPEESTSNREYDETNSFNILNRYSTDTIRRLLNDVAWDQTKKKDTSLYAKLGLKIPKYQHSGVLKDTYNDPSEYYDYSAGEYDSNTQHWSSRDPKTGLLLKNPKHTTFYKSVLEDEKLGYELYKDISTGRYYTLNPEEYITSSKKLTLRKVSDDERRELLGRTHLDTWRNRPDFNDVVPGFSKDTLDNRKAPYISTILKAAENQDINPEILDALFTQESKYDPNAESSAGAKGVGQLTDINTKDIDPFNPYQNILRSSEVLEWFRNRNNRDIKRAIAGYNGYTKPENAKRKMKKEDSLEVVRGKRSDNYYEVLYDLIDSLKQHSTVNYPFKKPNN